METRTHSGAYPMSFLLGFFAYCFFEIAIRGRTHWTMGVLGGGALCLLLCLMRHLRRRVLLCALLGTYFVTAAEFCSGVYLNLSRRMAVWDYSDLRLNLMGQICPQFSCVWFLLCAAGCLICSALDRQLHRAATE